MQAARGRYVFVLGWVVLDQPLIPFVELNKWHAYRFLQVRPGGSGAGRPTMEELFGEEEDDFGAAAAGGSAAAGVRYAAAAAEKARRQAEQEEAERRAAEEEAARRAAEEEAARAAALFPPQRLAANITGGTAVPVTAASGERVYCR